jgi:hypothetical protein
VRTSGARSCTPLAGVLVAALLLGCGAPAVAPMAAIDLSPAMLCEGKSTEIVTLSGKRSRDQSGSPDGLDFAWQTLPPPLEIVRGSKHQLEWLARFDARSPIAIELTVTDAMGETATRSRVLPLTRTTSTRCVDGCLAHELCAGVSGDELCVEAAACSGDDECGCLRCALVDDGSRHCLAR